MEFMQYLKSIKPESPVCATAFEIRPCEISGGMNFFALPIPKEKDLEKSLGDYLSRCGYHPSGAFSFLPSEIYKGEWVLELEPEVIPGYEKLKGPFSDVPPTSGLPYRDARFQHALSLFLFTQANLNAPEDVYLKYAPSWMDEAILSAVDTLLSEEQLSPVSWYLVEGM